MPAEDLIKNTLELYGQHSLSLSDLRQHVWDVLLKFPDSRDEILDVLDNHPQRTLAILRKAAATASVSLPNKSPICISFAKPAVHTLRAARWATGSMSDRDNPRR
jgi:hypothetical protein